MGSTVAAGLHLTIVRDAISGHKRETIDRDGLRRQLGPYYRIADVVARSRCGKCGAKKAKISVRVGSIHVGGTQKS